MKKTSFAVLIAAAGVAMTPSLATAAGVDYPNATWSEASINVPDGTVLHADVLRPKGLTNADKTPVIVSIGPYFNHSGQTGPAGPLEGTSYDPVGPNAGPSERFKDFTDGAKIFTRTDGPKYTFVMIDLRGFGGSTGCLDWGGPGEQADVVAAIKWAAEQPWSTGAVGTYGKSYDGMTGLMGAASRPAGLKAVVAQEPVYDNYRYLFGDGIRRLNSVLTPALYDAIAVTPGPVNDTTNPTYNVYGSSHDAQRPGCLPANWADQQNDDHYSPWWRQRNIITNIKGSQVPIFVTQGMTENNTAPDGLAEFLANHPGPERGWLGPWNHVRGADMEGNKLAMGRKGFYDEVMGFYDEYLADIHQPRNFAPFAIQSVTTGKWRPEKVWPPADVQRFTTELASGSYNDTGNSTRSSSTGVWTISKPLTNTVHMAGAAQVKVDVSSPTPRSNLVVDVYDLDATGKGPLVARQGSLIRNNGTVTLNLMSADWKFVAGHRIGVRVTDNNSDWWVAAVPTNQTVQVYGGEITLPLLTYNRSQVIQGDSGTQRSAWMSNTATAPAAAITAARDFNLGAPLLAQPDEMKAEMESYE